MDNNTYVYSKRELIDWLEKQLPEDSIILETQSLKNVSQDKKKNITMQFGLSGEAYKDNIGIVPVLGSINLMLSIPDKKYLQKKFIK